MSTSQPVVLPPVLSAPYAFLRPTSDLHASVVDSAKRILDPLAASVAEAQSARRQVNKKRKRSEPEPVAAYRLQLKSLYVDGFTSDQIWEQATRILESAGSEIERDFTLHAKNSGYPSPTVHERDLPHDISDPEASDSGSDSRNNPLDSLSDGASMDSSIGTGHKSDGENSHLDPEESEIASGMDEALSDDDTDHSLTNLSEEEPDNTYVEDRFGLNDGFFSVDDFNKQSEMLERQDAKGDVEEDENSDEEIDWHADPLMVGNHTSARKNDPSRNPRRLEGDDDDAMDDSSEDEGPTFGNADIHADSDSDIDDVLNAGNGDAGGWINTSDIKYADFFAPPPRKASSKKVRALPKTQPNDEVMDDDVDRAMADVRRDLFDEESSVGDEDDGMDESADPQAQHSTHEKQRARIAAEIRRLEAAGVGKKDWMLSGEARAVERPINSLIEEDLDFERIGKPVPVITNETTEEIEDLVKRRILGKEFDEVVRRRPGPSDAQTTRSSRFELDDTKPQQSLAELYEADHLRSADPNYVDPKDRKLMREHSEITNLWKEISSQLDTLSNWHYKPKVPQASINVVTDAPTIMMEEARPTAGSAVGESATLAPQEIYTPGGDGRVAGEVVLKNGTAISKEEMTREEKARMRRKNKKTHRRKANAESSTQQPGKMAEKQQLVSDLKKGGVKIIDKEGQMTDINGGKVDASTKNRADTLKL